MFEQTFTNIDGILWKEAGCSNELDYVEQTSWILFLKYLADLENECEVSHHSQSATQIRMTTNPLGVLQQMQEKIISLTFIQ